MNSFFGKFLFVVGMIIGGVGIGVVSNQPSVVFAQDKAPQSIIRDHNDFELPKYEFIGVEDSVIPYGDVIVVGVKVDNTPNLVHYHFDFKVNEANLKEKSRVFTNKDQIFFGAGIKKTQYLVNAVGVFEFEEKGPNGEILKVGSKCTGIHQFVFNVGEGPAPEPTPNPDPTPNPTPTPTPTPDPTFPVGTYDLSKKSYDWAKSVKTESRAKGAAALAASFEACAASAPALSLQDALQTAANSNDEALKSVGVSPSDWESFSVSLQDELYKNYESGKMKNTQDLKTAYMEVSAGLKAVK